MQRLPDGRARKGYLPDGSIQGGADPGGTRGNLICAAGLRSARARGGAGRWFLRRRERRPQSVQHPRGMAGHKHDHLEGDQLATTIKNIVSYGEFHERFWLSIGGERLLLTTGPNAGKSFPATIIRNAPGQYGAAQSTFTEELQFQGRCARQPPDLAGRRLSRDQPSAERRQHHSFGRRDQLRQFAEVSVRSARRRRRARPHQEPGEIPQRRLLRAGDLQLQRSVRGHRRPSLYDGQDSRPGRAAHADLPDAEQSGRRLCQPQVLPGE